MSKAAIRRRGSRHEVSRLKRVAAGLGLTLKVNLHDDARRYSLLYKFADGTTFADANWIKSGDHARMLAFIEANRTRFADSMREMRRLYEYDEERNVWVDKS